MHELSLCQNMRQIIEDEASKKGFVTVTTVNLLLGELTCVERSALEFSFSVCMTSTVAENANLHIDVVKGKAICQSCQHEFYTKQYFTPCPICESNDINIIAGEELMIQSMEAQ